MTTRIKKMIADFLTIVFVGLVVALVAITLLVTVDGLSEPSQLDRIEQKIDVLIDNGNPEQD